MAVAELTPDETLVRKERSLWEEAMIRLVRNKVAVASGIFLIVLVLATILADFIAPFGYAEQDLINNNAIPEWMLFLLPEGAENYARISDKFPLGADHLGRDLFSRALYGARVSLGFALVAATVSLVIGTIYGMISGYVGGKVDNFMMRIVDFLYAFPFLVVVILLQTYFKALERRGGASFIFDLNESMGGMFFLFIAIGLIDWIGMARIARGQVLQYKRMEFVEAAHAVGAGDSRIIMKHLLPNILGPLIVAESLNIPTYIFLEAFLSFIGLGVNPPTPSWGIMISEAVQGLRSYPNQVLVPALALSLTTLAFNFLGDGLRDALDPRLKQ
ncbi:MAG: ABC transporter permease [Anaerolineales bacterium]|nr:ABC transporter permease [Anaerolineales bacterium]